MQWQSIVIFEQTPHCSSTCTQDVSGPAGLNLGSKLDHCAVVHASCMHHTSLLISTLIVPESTSELLNAGVGGLRFAYCRNCPQFDNFPQFISIAFFLQSFLACSSCMPPWCPLLSRLLARTWIIWSVAVVQNLCFITTRLLWIHILWVG